MKPDGENRRKNCACKNGGKGKRRTRTMKQKRMRRRGMEEGGRGRRSSRVQDAHVAPPQHGSVGYTTGLGVLLFGIGGERAWYRASREEREGERNDVGEEVRGERARRRGERRRGG
eukprot:766454-Hanusia_phi.AAC.9